MDLGSLPTVEKCCCLLELQKGSLVIAIIEFILSLGAACFYTTYNKCGEFYEVLFFLLIKCRCKPFKPIFNVVNAKSWRTGTMLQS
nr:uncharacterized protein LOC112211379 [Halyomorpha halys]